MDVALKSNDQFFTLACEARDQLQKGHADKAVQIVRKIQRDGKVFRSNIDASKAKMERAFESNKTELEANQSRCHELQDQEESLKEQLGEHLIEVLLSSLFSSMFASGAEAASQARDEAQAAYARAREDRSEFNPLHLIPVFGWAAFAAQRIGGSARMKEAQQHQAAAEGMMQISRDLENATDEVGQEAIQNFISVHNERVECVESFDLLHDQNGKLKNGISLLLMGSKTLEDILSLTDSACGGTDRLRRVLEAGQQKPGLLGSKGTQSTVDTTAERWAELRDFMHENEELFGRLALENKQNSRIEQFQL